MALDDAKETRTPTQPEQSEQQAIGLVQLLKGDGPDKPQRRDVRELPSGRPTVGAGTRHSDIIRDRHPDDIRMHLGPRFRRGDIVEPRERPRGTDVPTTAVPAVSMENVHASTDFAERMRKEMDALPTGVRRLLADKGMVVIVAGGMIDAAPDLKGEHPRGWPPGTTFANEDGAFRPEQRAIMVAETFEDTDGKDVRSNRAEGVLRHETGHAVDAALDNYSQEDAFKAAYDQDVSAMPALAKQRLSYLLQPDGAGQQETFAEVFAALHGGSANANQTDLILANFPHVTELMKQKLATLK